MQTIILKVDNDIQADILIKLAKELHIEVDVINSQNEEEKSVLSIAEISFASDWDSKENEHWNEFLKNS